MLFTGNEICESQSDVAEIGIFENKLLIARAGAITGTILGLIVLLTSTVVGIIIIKRKGLQKALSIFIKHRHQQGYNNNIIVDIILDLQYHIVQVQCSKFTFIVFVCQRRMLHSNYYPAVLL